MTMQIRYAQEKDLDVIVNSNIAMAKETENKVLVRDTVRRGVQAIFDDSSKGFYLIVEFTSEPVGQLLVTTEWSDWRNGYFWWIQSVYVVPDSRRKGFYRALHEEVRQLAKSAKNVCGIRLYVDKANFKAQEVYRYLGMNETGYILFEEDWVG